MTGVFCGDASRCPFSSGCSTSPNTKLAAAVFAALGYAVYPASPASQAHHSSLGKLERGAGGFRIATTSIEQVQAWSESWAAGANIGLATGRASRLVVVDVDRPTVKDETSSSTPNGTAGSGSNGGVELNEIIHPDDRAAERVRDWARRNGVMLPGNVVSETPSGGRHIWIRLPAEGRWADEETPRRIGWLENVDLLWDRHSIKAPPSLRSGSRHKGSGAYRFTHGCPCQVPEASDELLDAMVATDERRRVATGVVSGNGSSGGGTGADSGADSGLDSRPDSSDPTIAPDGSVERDTVDIEETRKGVPLGLPEGQNGEFWRVACSLARRGWTHGDAVAFLMEVVEASPSGNDDDPWLLDDFTTERRTGIVDRAFEWVGERREEELGAYKSWLETIRL